MRVLMLVATNVAVDTRVLREAATLAAAGHQVHVIGRDVPRSFEPAPGVTVSSAGSPSTPGRARSGGPAARRGAVGRTLRWLLLPEHRNRVFRAWAREAELLAGPLEFDAVHAHDFTALVPGARLAQRRGVPLVYDSHEMWSGRPRVGRPTPLQHRREQRAEARLGGRADAVITVGDGVAEALRHAYGWQHTVIVRNTFPAPPQQPACTALPAPRRAVYAGRLAPYRELETIAEASRRTSLPILLVGPADETWLAGFDPGRVEIRDTLPVEEIDRLLAEAGLALVTHSDRWLNHRVAMPNKLFHAVRAGVPVVATDVGELARVVRKHGIGVLYSPGDPASLAAALEEATSRYPELVAAVRAAAAELSWDADARRLVAVYDGLDERRRHGRYAGRR